MADQFDLTAPEFEGRTVKKPETDERTFVLG